MKIEVRNSRELLGWVVLPQGRHLRCGEFIEFTLRFDGHPYSVDHRFDSHMVQCAHMKVELFRADVEERLVLTVGDLPMETVRRVPTFTEATP